jgi:hypothetical protein
MIKKIIIIYLLIACTSIMAGSGLKYESIEVKITGIDLINQSLNYVENNIPKTLKIDEEVILQGYYINATENKNLADIELNQKYFIRIAYYNNENEKDILNKYVSFISTVHYDTLY